MADVLVAQTEWADEHLAGDAGHGVDHHLLGVLVALGVVHVGRRQQLLKRLVHAARVLAPCCLAATGNVSFNDALNTFYLRLYGVRHMVKDHSDSEKGEREKCFI